MAKKIQCRTIDGGVYEASAEELSFRPSVYGVAIKDDKVLLVPQFGDGYDFPGGGVDLGELLTDTLIREVKEETGLDVEPGHVLLVKDNFFFHPYKKKALQTPLTYFLCEVVGGELSMEGFDEHEKEYAQKAEWVALDQVPHLKFYNDVDSPQLIKDALWMKEILLKKPQL
jgi:ADP-ribose pyrophosphatase YjhB (NUDIX family)